MKKQLIVEAICLLVLSTGCAGVKIYSDAAMQHPTAIQFHYAKPFLLVEHNANKDGTIKTTLIYLPDQNQTYYAKMVNGMGNSDLKIAFENGSIASLGTSSDNKILLSTGSLSGLISDLVKTPNPVSIDRNYVSQEPTIELFEIITSDGKMSLKKVDWQK